MALLFYQKKTFNSCKPYVFRNDKCTTFWKVKNFSYTSLICALLKSLKKILIVFSLISVDMFYD